MSEFVCFNALQYNIFYERIILKYSTIITLKKGGKNHSEPSEVPYSTNRLQLTLSVRTVVFWKGSSSELKFQISALPNTS